MLNHSQFVEFKNTRNIWAIGSIHSNLDSFELIKENILKNFSKKDKLVFLGNVIGLGNKAKETLSSVIDMRNYLLSKFYLKSEDVVFLRGAQEEMFLKLLQLHTAPNPQDIIKWMFEHGVDKTVESYGFARNEIEQISFQGTLSINRWTSLLNKCLKKIPGHYEYFTNLRHAAFEESKKILFVNRGVDISRPLSAQSDCFWWGYQNFSKLNEPYKTFNKIVRGYESAKPNNNSKSSIVCSLYKPPLNNKKILAGLFDDKGKVLDLFESN